jgi:hypothetical protein
MSGLSAPLEGLQRSEAQLAESAKRLSRLPAAFTSLLSRAGGSTAGASADPVDIVDISAESIAMMQARNVAEANIAAIQTMDQVQQHLLSFLA